MPLEIATAHDSIVLDACCIIALNESGRMEEILSCIPKKLMVGQLIKEQEVLSTSLDDLSNRGYISFADIETEEEAETFVNLATRLGDGEALTGALAIHRNWAIATDDRKARNAFTKLAPSIALVSTLQLVEHWARITSPKEDDIKEALRRLRLGTPYRPKPDHPQYPFWQQYMD